MKFSILPALAASASLAAATLTARPIFPLQKRENETKISFYQGFDLSSLVANEQDNIVFKDTFRDNITRPAEDILMEYSGMNTVRLRLWVNPIPGQYDLPYTLALAQRLHAKGIKIYIVYHFSDSWADPGKQITPAAWPANDLDALSATLRTYVRDTLLAFHEGGVPVEIASLGNEARTGILWPLGRVDSLREPREDRIAMFQNLGTLWNSARLGVDDAVAAGVAKPLVMLHVDNGFDQPMLDNWFDALFATGKVTREQVDVIGLTCYPYYDLTATAAKLLSSLNLMADNYGIPMHLVETNWPVQCSNRISDESIPRSVEGQRIWTKQMLETMRSIKGGLGQGISYWEPTWVNNTSLGSPCEDNVLFQADWSTWPGQISAYSRASVDLLQQ
ncbi:family 53 glycosyl hydrolase [Elsinoe ampelina]|uniref:Arabinogalactan endo-beta-1,4-galactanase n=1 Tax=Elsinoe ampelina TaxID=302913 RepID=A0A6A6GFK9_9PEZI|nr:family 53 glycosyl hydrolase [Elsinoe ampelina]